MITLRAPFPWFGGKSRVADVVWRAFGNVPNYVEPFFGSGAVLLGRPHEPKIETVNDLDCYLANFFRAVQADALAVAHWCDDPVNEADLHARHRWLVNRAEFREHMKNDPDFYDVKIAGWWVWGLSMWIGGGWCASANVTERRPEITDGGGGVHKRGHELDPKRPSVPAGHEGKGVHRKLPDLYTRGFGRGIRSAAPERGETECRTPAKRPNARNGGQGVHRREVPSSAGVQLPNLHGTGRGTHSSQPGRGGAHNPDNGSRLPSLGNERGVHGADTPPCADWFAAIQARLRRVRVCCGDWTRVLGNSVIGTTTSRNSGMNPCAIFLDPRTAATSAPRTSTG